MKIDRASYAYPIFDQDYGIAVAIGAKQQVEGRRRDSGGMRIEPPDAETVAPVFKKNAGRWTYSVSYVLAIT